MESVLSEDYYVPGDNICQSCHAQSGYGTYVRDGYIKASLPGQAKIDREIKAETNTMSLPVVSIKTLKDKSVIMPHVGSLVIAKIISVNQKYAKCSILFVDNQVTKEKFPGQINRKDIRATEKDKIEISKSFRCGDIVIARVISLGDTNSYFLSCAENELGVVIAYSESSGSRMIPISWNEMQCPVNFQKEYRKVAKVQADFINYVDQKEKDQNDSVNSN